MVEKPGGWGHLVLSMVLEAEACCAGSCLAGNLVHRSTGAQELVAASLSSTAFEVEDDYHTADLRIDRSKTVSAVAVFRNLCHQQEQVRSHRLARTRLEAIVAHKLGLDRCRSEVHHFCIRLALPFLLSSALGQVSLASVVCPTWAVLPSLLLPFVVLPYPRAILHQSLYHCRYTQLDSGRSAHR